MTKKTILVDGHVLDGKPQGTSAYIAGLYKAVAESGEVDVKIACHASESLERWDLTHQNIDWVPIVSDNRYKRLGVEMTQLQKSIAPDFAHFQYITPLVKKCPWINNIHDLIFLDMPEYFPLRYRLQNGALFRISALRSDIILTISDHSKAAIERLFKIDPKKIYLTHVAIDSFLETVPEPIEDVNPNQYLTYISRFEPRKNQHALVNAFVDVEANLPRNMELIIVGYPALEYPELDAAWERVKKGNHRVRHLSNLTQGQLTWLYKNARAAIYPSFAEGFGMPVIEAIAAGGASYCADNTALSELKPYVNGMFDPSSPGEIKAAIITAIEGEKAKNNAGLREKTIERFSWKNSSDTLLRALDEYGAG